MENHGVWILVVKIRIFLLIKRPGRGYGSMTAVKVVITLAIKVRVRIVVFLLGLSLGHSFGAFTNLWKVLKIVSNKQSKKKKRTYLAPWLLAHF